MQQIKIFKGLENDVGMLEEEVNAWLLKTGAKVISITGNIAPQSGNATAAGGTLGKSPHAPSDVILVVLYED